VDLAQHFIERTKTTTGLGVTVRLLDKVYQTGRKYAVDFKHTMKIVFDDYGPPVANGQKLAVANTPLCCQRT
jgi:hypothetical protein